MPSALPLAASPPNSKILVPPTAPCTMCRGLSGVCQPQKPVSPMGHHRLMADGISSVFIPSYPALVTAESQALPVFAERASLIVRASLIHCPRRCTLKPARARESFRLFSESVNDTEALQGGPKIKRLSNHHHHNHHHLIRRKQIQSKYKYK